MFLTKKLLLCMIPVLTGPLAITCLPDAWRFWPEARGAVPDPVIEERSLQCDIYVAVIDLLGALGGPATAFCSSYLHIPGALTVEATVTAEPITHTCRDIGTSICAPLMMARMLKERRTDGPAIHIEARATPAALKGLSSGEISAACSCLHITPAVVQTETFTAPGSVVTETLH